MDITDRVQTTHGFVIDKTGFSDIAMYLPIAKAVAA